MVLIAFLVFEYSRNADSKPNSAVFYSMSQYDVSHSDLTHTDFKDVFNKCELI